MQTHHRTLHYRSAYFATLTNGLTLQQMLAGALVKYSDAEDREKQIGNTQEFELLNSHAPHGTVYCGIFHRWTKGEHQLVVNRVRGAKSWAVEEVAPPPAPAPAPGIGQVSSPAPQREFLPHTLYFGIRDNHCIVAQTQGLKAEHLADYLCWLIGKDVGVPQAMSFQPASAAMLRLKGVGKAKGIKIKTKLSEEVQMQPPPGDKRRKPWIERKLNTTKSDAIRSILSILGVTLNDGQMSSDETKNLELRLEIRSPHDQSENGNVTMNHIAGVVAQNSDENYAVILENDSLLKGNELSLKKPVIFQMHDGATHPASSRVFKEIDDYLCELIAGGKV
jgi:hypothetical protein